MPHVRADACNVPHCAEKQQLDLTENAEIPKLEDANLAGTKHSEDCRFLAVAFDIRR